MTAKQTKQAKQKKQCNNLRKNHQLPKPVLRFSPTAWAKLLYFRDRGETEISGFGVTESDDLLFITDFITVKQEATVASISLDDEAVADFFENQVDAGRKPEQFFRIWLHSHPGDSPDPSYTDEETFSRVFGECDWAVMCIIAKDGKTYARLRFNVGPGGQLLIPVHIDYQQSFGSSDRAAWEAEYKANIKTVKLSSCLFYNDEYSLDQEELDMNTRCLSHEILEQLEEMEPAERKAVLDELAGESDLWNESEAMFYD